MKNLLQTIVRGFGWKVGALVAVATVGALIKAYA